MKLQRFQRNLRIYFFMKLNRDQLSRLLHSNWSHLVILVALCSGVCRAQNAKLSSGKLAKIEAAAAQLLNDAVVRDGLTDHVIKRLTAAPRSGAAARRTGDRSAAGPRMPQP